MQQTNPGSATGIFAGADLPIGFPAITLKQGTIAAGSTSANVWTPSLSTLKFRLLGWEISYTINDNLGTAADITVSLEDGGTGFLSWGVYIPATVPAGPGIVLVSRVRLLPAGGYLSSALNNSLTLNLSSAVTNGTFQCIAWGLEASAQA